MINKVIISGRVGQKPELRKTTSGISWTRFSVCTEEAWKDKTTGEKKVRKDWHEVKAWRGLAESIATWVVQGQYLEIIGSLRHDVVQKPDGSKAYYHYIQADRVEFREKPKSYWDAVAAGKIPQQIPAAQQSNPVAPMNPIAAQIAQLQQQLLALTSQMNMNAGVMPTSPVIEEEPGFPEYYEEGAQPVNQTQNFSAPKTLVAGL